MRPTYAQLRYLRVIDQHGDPGSGWAEIDLQFTCQSRIPDYLEAATCERIAKALARKGLIEKLADGPVITDAGRAVLAEFRS